MNTNLVANTKVIPYSITVVQWVLDTIKVQMYAEINMDHIIVTQVTSA